jgi:uncharacterized membrane protein
MQEPFQTPPPIPSPLDVAVPNTNVSFQGPRVWKEAPQIVKSASLLAFLGIVGIPLVLLLMFFVLSENQKSAEDTAGKIVLAIVLFIFWFVAIWLRSAFRKGTRAAWTVQIVLSILGLTSFPLGTLIHAYLLFHWFKPETKAWFGVQ